MGLGQLQGRQHNGSGRFQILPVNPMIQDDASAHGSNLGTQSPKLVIRNWLNETELRDVRVSKMF